MNTTQGENMDLSTITTDDLLAEVARRIEGQTKPESENWPMVNGYEIKPGADLRDADLMRANLVRTDLMYADLMRADLRGANLVHANLVHADLGGANLMYADLRGACLRGADLVGADLRDARVSDTTIINLPAGWKIENGLIAALEGER